MGVVQQAVADRVGQGGLAEVVVPLGGWQLARDDGRVGAIAILQDLEEVAALRILDRRQPPVVDDEDIEAGELGEQADVGAIGPGQGELVEEARSPAVAGAIALATGLVRQRTGEEAFPDTGRPDQDGSAGRPLRNRCPQGQADPRAAIAGGASGVTMARRVGLALPSMRWADVSPASMSPASMR